VIKCLRWSIAARLAILLMIGLGLANLSPAQSQSIPTPTPNATPLPVPPSQEATSKEPVSNEPIGNVVGLTGSATVTRNNATTALQAKDDIFPNDVLRTAAASKLNITFNDATTFNLSANAQVTVDRYLYEDNGKQNTALFDIAKGTVAFAAAAVAKTGDMKISTPTATLGIRGTTGLVEVPESASTAGANPNVAIKLYPDADGKVGRIEVNDRAGARLGLLTQGASGFAIRPGIGGARFAAIALSISPQQALRDQGFVRQVHSAQTLGRRIVSEQRTQRLLNPNRPASGQPGRTPQRPGVRGRVQPGATPQKPGVTPAPDRGPKNTTPGNSRRSGQTPNGPGQAPNLTPNAAPALPGRSGEAPSTTPARQGAVPGLQRPAGQLARPAAARPVANQRAPKREKKKRP